MSERPGEHPFTRGIHPGMYRDRLWTMRQYSGFGTARQTNERYRHLLAQGQTGLSVAFDLPTQMGYDPDAPMARAEVGKAGVSIATLEDMKVLLDGIPLDRVSVSMTINATAPVLLALLVALAEESGVERARLRGTVQNDILKEFVARGCYIYPPAASMRLAADVAEFCVREMPRWNFISVSGYHMREAGATAAQEIGLTIADGIAYVEALRARGLAVDEIGRQLSFFFACHSRFLEEIAKFRAARRLWARVMRDRFGAQDPRACMLRFHTQTGGVTLTAQQPQNNLVRVALQAMAAILGGTQSLHTNAMDEALALPSEPAAKLALRTQQILAYETGVPEVADPLGGSWELEKETDRLEAEAEALVRRVDELGGAVAAIERRFHQSEIERSAWEAQKRVESGQDVVVGVNRYREEGEAPRTNVLKVDEDLARERAREVGAVRERRDAAAARRAREALVRAAAGQENLVGPILGCVRARVTLGEIGAALEESFGRYTP